MPAIASEVESSQISQHESRVRKNIFKHIEAERKRTAEVLQEDIAQLVAIAKVMLSEKKTPDVDDYLTMALTRLRKLSFNIKPQILESFGLEAALQELAGQYVHVKNDVNIMQASALPDITDPLMQVALFRLMQGVLHNLVTFNLQNLSYDVNRLDGRTCIEFKVTLRHLPSDLTGPELTEQLLTKDITHIMYLFDGTANFQLLNSHEAELRLYLCEL